jgi:hypothetical protein
MNKFFLLRSVGVHKFVVEKICEQHDEKVQVHFLINIINDIIENWGFENKN